MSSLDAYDEVKLKVIVLNIMQLDEINKQNDQLELENAIFESFCERNEV